MGQKINPTSLRLALKGDWKSKWMTKKNYAEILHQDLKIRQTIEEEFKTAGISEILIERKQKEVRIIIYSSRPGMIIGHSGEGATKLNEKLEKIANSKVKIEVMEIKKPDLDARLLAEGIVYQLERRMPFRRIMKQAIEKAMSAGAKGIRVRLSGRLGGIAIARSETAQEGSVSLHTLRAKIDYAGKAARTNTGLIGVKVWLNRGIKYKKN
jgi:small subunit ribosomal protein S3